MKHDRQYLESEQIRLSDDTGLGSNAITSCIIVAEKYAEHVHRWRETSTPPVASQTITICHDVDLWADVVDFDPVTEPHDLFMANATHWMPFEWPESSDQATLLTEVAKADADYL